VAALTGVFGVAAAGSSKPPRSKRLSAGAVSLDAAGAAGAAGGSSPNKFTSTGAGAGAFLAGAVFCGTLTAGLAGFAAGFAALAGGLEDPPPPELLPGIVMPILVTFAIIKPLKFGTISVSSVTSIHTAMRQSNQHLVDFETDLNAKHLPKVVS
jgi:hypothetical protein